MAEKLIIRLSEKLPVFHRQHPVHVVPLTHCSAAQKSLAGAAGLFDSGRGRSVSLGFETGHGFPLMHPCCQNYPPHLLVIEISHCFLLPLEPCLRILQSPELNITSASSHDMKSRSATQKCQQFDRPDFPTNLGNI